MKGVVKVSLLFYLFTLLPLNANAQPAARRAQQQKAKQQTNANNITTRSQISFPVAQEMPEDVVWRRDIYRELLFTYVFKLMMTGSLKVYEYRLDGNEVFNDSARVKPLNFLDNYHIYYERNNGRIRLDNSDIPSREVRSYYLKESAYYDQGTGTFHRKVVALCPIMAREDDFGDMEQKYPLFWIRYDDLAPFLSKQTMMTSNLNNAATMSVDDYFTMNQYKGKIYKTTNMLGRTLSQYCPTDSAMAKEQRKIEQELLAFEKNLFGDQQKKDSLDSIAAAEKELKAPKKSRSGRRGGSSVRSSRRSGGSNVSSGSAARVSVRRERH